MEHRIGQGVSETLPYWHDLARYIKDIERLARQNSVDTAVTLLHVVHYQRLHARRWLARNWGIKVRLREGRPWAEVVAPECVPEDVDELISAMHDQTGEALKRLDEDDRIVGPASALSRDCGRAIWSSTSLEILFDGMVNAGKTSVSKAVCKVFVQHVHALPIAFFGEFSMGPKSCPESREAATKWLSGWVASRTSVQRHKRVKDSLSSISDELPFDALLRELPAAVLGAWAEGNGLQGFSTLDRRARNEVLALGREVHLKAKLADQVCIEETPSAKGADLDLLHFEAREAARQELNVLISRAKLSPQEHAALELDRRGYTEEATAKELGVAPGSVKSIRSRYRNKLRRAAS